MHRLWSSCFGSYQVVPEELGENLVNELSKIVESTNALSGEILQNKIKFDDFFYRYKRLSEAPHFEQGDYSQECENLNTELAEFLQLRKEQEQRRAELRKNYKDVFCGNLNPIDPEQIELIKQYTKAIETNDKLDELDSTLPKMRNWTCDATQELRGSVCCSCFFWLGLCCNEPCCGLRGRVQQLKYATQQGMNGPSCCSMT